jgi:hypothetical protein
LREIEPAKKSLNLTLKANFAITSLLSKNGQNRGKEKIDPINLNDKLYCPLRQKIQPSKNEEPNRAQCPLFEV